MPATIFSTAVLRSGRRSRRHNVQHRASRRHLKISARNFSPPSTFGTRIRWLHRSSAPHHATPRRRIPESSAPMLNSAPSVFVQMIGLSAGPRLGAHLRPITFTTCTTTTPSNRALYRATRPGHDESRRSAAPRHQLHDDPRWIAPKQLNALAPAGVEDSHMHIADVVRPAGHSEPTAGQEPHIDPLMRALLQQTVAGQRLPHGRVGELPARTLDPQIRRLTTRNPPSAEPRHPHRSCRRSARCARPWASEEFEHLSGSGILDRDERRRTAAPGRSGACGSQPAGRT